jgi:LysM repeat protein
MADLAQRNIDGTKLVPRRRRRQTAGGLIDRYTPRAMALGVALGLGISAIIVGLISISLYGYFQVGDLILPGVYVGEVGLGGLTVEQATDELNRTWNVERGLIITDGERTWHANPTEFGLALDAAATARRAGEIGHGKGMLAEFADMVDSALNGRVIPPVVTIDHDAAVAGLEAWAEVVDLPPQNATISLEDGQVVAVDGVPGHTLDVEQTLAVLSTEPGLALADGYLPLVLVPVAPEIDDASGAIAQAQAMLSGPVQVKVYDPIRDERSDWTATPELIATWLSVEENGGELDVVVGPDGVADYLGTLDDALGAGRYLDVDESVAELTRALRDHSTASLIVSHDPTTYVVQPGDTLTSISWQVGIPYWRILDANPGVDANSISTGQELTIPSVDDMLPLPVIENKRIVISISEQRMWAYQDGQLWAENVISTGIDRSPTQPGYFQVQTHELSAYASVWDLTMPHFLGIYESWPGFMNGLHGLPTLSNGQILWADVLGRPASYGCIILDLDAAEALYNWADDGVVVEIRE